MCRFVLYLGPKIPVSSLVTDPHHSMIRQSFKAKERSEPLNGDGFGVAWYARDYSNEPAVFRDISPAWNNQNLLNIARVVSSDCILAHVRAASPGLPVSQLNCHPFVWRNITFMHNGELDGFADMRRKILARLSEQSFRWIKGSTDSEHIFALFIDNYLTTDDSEEPLERLKLAVHSTLGELRILASELGRETDSHLNLAVSDGDSAIVTRVAYHSSPQSLYMIGGRQYECQDGVCVMQPGGSSAVLVASEPLSDEPGWTSIQANHMVVIPPSRMPEHVPL